MKMVRAFLIDNQVLYRNGVYARLNQEEDIDVIGEAEDAEEAFPKLHVLLPEVVLLACKPLSVDNFKLVRQIRQHFPRIGIIILAERETDELLFLAIKAGAAAYFTKEVSPEELIDAVRRVSRGEYLINESPLTRPDVASRILKQFQELPDLSVVVNEVEPFLSPLTPREVEILSCIAHGNSNKGIAHILSISEQTVKNHIASILRKLVANDRTHAVVLALRQGLIRLD
jgi:DNA-binding NarL/FixJ family response regulator